MAQEWGERQPDGSVKVYQKDDSGNVSMVRQESWAQNQGQPAAASSGGGQTYQTPNGPRTLDQIRSELQKAGYNGATDAASLVAAYNKVSSGGGAATTGGGLTSLVDASASGAREKFDWTKLSDAQRIALQYLGYDASLAAAPEDWLKYNKYTSGGRDILQQLWGNEARPLFSGITGAVTPNSAANVLGGGTDQNAALDAIWKSRPDLANFFRANGKDASTPEQQRALTQEWLGFTNEPEVTAAGRNAATYATQKGWLAATPTASGITAGAVPSTGPGGSVTIDGQQYGVPAYNQINPAVWDSLGPVGQAMAKGLFAQAGGSPEEAVSQIDATRPKGTAPAQTAYNWGQMG